MAFEAAEKERVFGAVINEFVQHWDVGTIALASQRVRGIVDSTFEIRPGQLIFASEANGDFILLAAWWPWANGTIKKHFTLIGLIVNSNFIYIPYHIV